MPEIVNTQPLQSIEDANANPSQRETMIKIDNVSMVFNMASEQLNSLKEYAIAAMRRELRFREFRALDNISLEVKKGDVYGIVGTNGSGKSTLLKIVAGVLDPTEGTVQINGNIAPLIELGAGFDLELTARENIYLNGALLGYSKNFIEDHFDEIVAFAEIEKFLDMPMKNYSSGMVARIAFAIATVIVPDILIVDEVLAVGDFMFQQKCERRISELINEHDVTVLIVSHSNEQIERLCNKAIWIEKGHTRMAGSAEEVCRIYNVLGGHAGNPENEKLIYEMFLDKTPVEEGIIETIASEDRYGSASRLCSLTSADRVADTVVIAPGESASSCLIASTIAQAAGYPILLSKRTHIPDATAHELKKIRPRKALLIGSMNEFSKTSRESLRSLVPTAEFVEIIEPDAYKLSTVAYRLISNNIWGETALITWDGCNGDLISLSGYMAENKVPLFYSKCSGLLESDLTEILKSRFKHVIALGNTEAFPKDSLIPLKEYGIAISQIYGKDPYDANVIINDWIDERRIANNLELSHTAIITSVWDPFDALTVGKYAAQINASILLEDPQNLDSVAYAINFIKKGQGRIRRLIFLGNHTRFTSTDKEILGKAVSKYRSSSR